MTRDREIPDSWPASRSSNPDRWSLDTRGAASGRARERDSDIPQRSTPVQDNTRAAVTQSSESHQRGKKKRLRVPTSLKFWAAVTVFVSGSLGFVSMALLFKLAPIPNCPAIFWPMASASLRLSCAQLAASKETVDDLLSAIALVNSLPSDHALRPLIDGYIQEWSLDILKLAEQSFQDGKLEEAIAVARKIPDDTSAYKLVEERVDKWQSTWSKAQEIYQTAEQYLRESKWHEAFNEAVKLTNISNTYWATTKYEELADLIHVAREDSAKLDKAFQLAKAGGLNNLLQAVKIGEAINSQSYAYKEAQDLLAKCGQKLLKLAQERLDAGDWQKVVEIANKMPVSVNLQAEVQDLTDLGNAQSRASEGTVVDLESAIALAQKLQPGRPLYDKAQQLIGRWQLETGDVANLQRAREFAFPGGVNDLRMAIAQAQMIPVSNPRGSEAKDQINRWVAQIQTMEDRPVLDRADQLANFGNVPSLQDAINQASQISRGRVLYQEARTKIGQWTDQIQRMQDQPYLDQAEAQANTGNLSKAIAIALQIRSGRVLYQEAQSNIRQWSRQLQRLQDQPYLDQAEAQANSGNLSSAVAIAQQIRPGRALSDRATTKIRSWQREIRAEQNLRSAYDLANSGTAEALVAAMRSARQVPTSSKLRGEAQEVMNRWSNQLLTMAQERSATDVQGAIDIAKAIPSGTTAYAAAQLEIQTWQKRLEPTLTIDNY